MQQTNNDANHSHEAKKKHVLYEYETLVFGMDIGWLNWNFTRKRAFFFSCVIPHYGLPSIWSLLCENINWKIVIDIPPSQILFFLQKCWNELTSKSFATLLTLSNVLSQNCTGGKLQFLSYSVITLTGMRGSGLLLTAFDLIISKENVQLILLSPEGIFIHCSLIQFLISLARYVQKHLLFSFLDFLSIITKLLVRCPENDIMALNIKYMWSLMYKLRGCRSLISLLFFCLK